MQIIAKVKLENDMPKIIFLVILYTNLAIGRKFTKFFF